MRERIKTQFISLTLIIQFLTRIPLPNQDGVTEDHFREGLKFFPFAGVIIGAVLSVVWMISVRLVGTDGIFTPVVLVITGIVMTGGLHLDGLADSFDGLYSNRNKDRILEIMKDSRIGSNGVLALVGLLSLKIAALSAIAILDPITLVLMPAFARFNVLILCFKATSARPGGMGDLFIGKVRPIDLVVGGMTLALVGSLRPMMLLIVPLMMLFTLVFRRQVVGKIDGITGDIIGATIEMNEVCFLICTLVLMNN